MELPVKQFQTHAEQAFVDLFNSAEQALPGAGNPWIADLRAKAIDAYAALGLPHRRVEAWKYTDLRSRLTEALPWRAPQASPSPRLSLAKRLGPRSQPSRPIGSSSSRASSGLTCQTLPG